MERDGEAEIETGGKVTSQANLRIETADSREVPRGEDQDE